MKMSKRIFALAIALTMLFLVGCNPTEGGNTNGEDMSGGNMNEGNMNEGGNMNRGDYFMLFAVVQGVYDDRIEVEVIESDYAFGIYWVRTGDQTTYSHADGSPATRSDIEAGQTIRISYNGQTMMSLPPQIVAHGIVIE